MSASLPNKSARSAFLGVTAVVVGVATLLVAFVMGMGVAANFPETWFGAVLVLSEAALGFVFIWHGVRRLWAISK
jgi:hypothetical protein